ncbi:uncharacterized protein TNCV_548821 [Trichonephila clavipes]|nr:uncharacterized protein TNCV_548821 [Trichonephila clavipes]
MLTLEPNAVLTKQFFIEVGKGRMVCGKKTMINATAPLQNFLSVKTSRKYLVSEGRTGSWGCGSPVVKVSDHGRHVTSSSPVPLKTRRVGQRCKLNLSRAQTLSHLCGAVVKRGGASSGVVLVT